MRAGCKHFRTASGLPANCRQPPNHSSHLFLDGASPHFCSFRIPSGVQSGPLFALPLGKRPPPFLCVWLSVWFMALERWPGGSNLKPLSEVVAQMNMVPVKSCLPLVLLLCHLFCGMKYEVWKIRLPNWVRGAVENSYVISWKVPWLHPSLGLQGKLRVFKSGFPHLYMSLPWEAVLVVVIIGFRVPT